MFIKKQNTHTHTYTHPETQHYIPRLCKS